MPITHISPSSSLDTDLDPTETIDARLQEHFPHIYPRHPQALLTATNEDAGETVMAAPWMRKP